MSEWQTLHQDLARLDTKASASASLDIHDLWDMYQEGLFLREMLYEHLDKMSPEEVYQAATLLVTAEQKLHDKILAQAPLVKAEIRDWLRQRVVEYEQKIRDIASDVGRSPVLAMSELQGYASDLSFLKRLASLIEHGTYAGTIQDTLREIHQVVIQAAEAPTLFRDALLSQKLSRLRTDALIKEVGCFQEETDRLLQSQSPKWEEIWRAMAWGSTILPNMSRRNPDHQALYQTCQQNREKLRTALATYVEKSEPHEKYKLLEKLATEMHDQANDTLGQITEMSLPASIKSMGSMRKDTGWLVGILKKYGKRGDMPPSLTAKTRKLRKADKYLRGERLEKLVEERLYGIFGQKFVKFFDNLILVLILSVIVLLVGEVYAPPHLQKYFIIADTTICAIFLLEFFTKLFLAEEKLLYVGRHWFTDLVPSIPFGLILFGLEQLHALSAVHSAQWFWFLQLSRLIRYIRILRPAIRTLRMASFFLRALDRLVRRYAKTLNRNIICFGSATEIATYREPTLCQKIQSLYAKALSRSRSLLPHIGAAQALPVMAVYLESLAVRVESSKEHAVVHEAAIASQDILVEDVLHTLLALRGAQVEDLMGNEFAYRLHRYMGLVDIPLVRRLPVVSTLVAKQKNSSPPEFTAWLGRFLGRILEEVLDSIYWVADLYGIVTGPRLVDKLGNALKNSFQRPAKQLLMMGGIFLFLHFLMSLLPADSLPFLQDIVQFLKKYVGLPMIILGVSCLIPLILGMWLQHVGGEATGFYERTAEAQFINLLKDLKHHNAPEDLNILYNRVLRPEVEIAWHKDGDPYTAGLPGATSLINWMKSSLTDWMVEESSLNVRVTTKQEARRWKLQREVMLLYKDYLDGALFHKSDVKTTEQLLGNLMIGNILVHRLGYSRKEIKALEKLDLSRSRSIVGPYLWFNLITQSVAHNVAQLLVEYNRHAISEAMIPFQPPQVMNEYRQWLSCRLAHEVDEELQQNIEDCTHGKAKHLHAAPLYHTTQFTAIHFLCHHKSQDEAIRVNFEERLYQAFLQDRKYMIREIFGSYPLHDLPKAHRSFNLFYFYQEYVAGGRVFLLPLRIIVWILQLAGWFLQWVWAKIKEIIHPDEEQQPVPLSTDFHVIIRKINRMRKPVYIASMKVRAQFDFEYLGLRLAGAPGIAPDSLSLGPDEQAAKDFDYPYQHDLAFIHALYNEWDFFHELRQKRSEELHRFSEFLHDQRWDGNQFTAYLDDIGHGLVPRQNDILRALAIAYTTDYQKLASLIEARKALQIFFEQTLAQKGKIVGYHWYHRLGRWLWRSVITCGFMRRDRQQQMWNQLWKDIGYEQKYGRPERRWCWNGYLAKRRTLKPLLYLIVQNGGVARIDDLLQNIIRSPGPWTEELIAIRTVQTLAVLDIRNYRRHIAELGEYGK